MKRVAGSKLWYAVAQIEPLGRAHSFYYMVDGKKFGGSLDVPAFGPLSLSAAGSAGGEVVGQDCPHQQDLRRDEERTTGFTCRHNTTRRLPAALMVVQDGGGTRSATATMVLNVIDNLIAQKKIPVMICVFINPGDISGSPGTPTYNFVKAYSEKWKRI